MARRKLTPKQRKRFFKIRREQGPEAAKEFRQGIISGSGSQYGGQPDPTKPGGAIALQAEAQKNVQGANLQSGRFDWTDPYGNKQQWSQDPKTGEWSLSQRFSDAQQAQYNQLQGAASGAIRQIGKQGAYDTSGIAQSQWQGYGGLPDVSWQSNDFSADRQRIEGDLYDRYSEKLGREWERRREDHMQTLADRGIPMGSEAWNRELESFDEREGQAYDQAMTRSIETGGTEQSRLYGMSLQDLGAQMDVRNLYGGERERDFAAQLNQEQNAIGRYQDQYWSPYQQLGNIQGFQAGLQAPNFGAPYQSAQPYYNAGGYAQGYYGIDSSYDAARYAADAATHRAGLGGGGGYYGGPPPGGTPLDPNGGGGGVTPGGTTAPGDQVPGGTQEGSTFVPDQPVGTPPPQQQARAYYGGYPYYGGWY